MTGADPFSEIRLLSVRSIQGANFWSNFPVTRLDMTAGAFDEISSAEVPGFTDALVAAFPGLIEHRCSIGERGGFITRLRRGTYAPHIVEHLALELQSMVGHDVGYGRARGGDRAGEYTVVFEHIHAGVGAAAGREAVALVQRAMAGEALEVDASIAELRTRGEMPDLPSPDERIICAITGTGDLEAVRDELDRNGVPGSATRTISPADILEHGLPYARSEIAIIMSSDVGDVPERYSDPEFAARLLSVVGDGVRRGGTVVVPANDWEVQDLIKEAGRRVAVFAPDDSVTHRDTKIARAVAVVRDDQVLIECVGCETESWPLRNGVARGAQSAAGMAAWLLRRSERSSDASSAEPGRRIEA